ncbi:macro domain-containing protein [Candidatus Protochlamydia phocaeensis]|uniref:macro domain-containing protein n=1 Tax=Candidatus Protochlamydia phocaeensis TaxID=1414722 RepID=UPI0008381441|nr:macro domain-containing protein [Candidatus Protochlamydia phocaeensis]
MIESSPFPPSVSFWAPVKVSIPASPSLFHLFFEIGYLADHYLYLGDQEVSLHSRKFYPFDQTVTADVKIKPSLVSNILKVSSFVLSFFILPCLALPFKLIYKLNLKHLKIQSQPSPRIPPVFMRQTGETTSSLHALPSTRNVCIAEKLIGQTKIALMTGDITNESADVIVNAANAYLIAGNGVCGAIHGKAGSPVLYECQEILANLKKYPLSCGDAVLTSSGYLENRIKAIVHAVGPDCRNGQENQRRKELLQRVYRNALTLCADPVSHPASVSSEIDVHSYRTIAFPSISTGIYCYPLKEAAEAALEAVAEFIKQHPKAFDEIRFVFLPAKVDPTVNFYQEALQKL